MDSRRSPEPRPVLITDAQQSRIDEHNARRRRYTITMGARVLCLIAAGIFYHTVWLMGILVGLACVLPWMAVMIANDRPPKKKAQRVSQLGHPSPERALDSGQPGRTIEG